MKTVKLMTDYLLMIPTDDIFMSTLALDASNIASVRQKYNYFSKHLLGIRPRTCFHANTRQTCCTASLAVSNGFEILFL